MNDLLSMKVIKEHSTEAFESAVLEFVALQESFGRNVTIHYTPLMQANGKVLYMAVIEARL